MHHGRLFLPHLLCQTGFQFFHLLREASAEFVQKGLLPSSRGVLCAEEVVDLLGHLMEDRDGLSLLDLLAFKLLLGESKVISVLHARERRESPHLSQEYQGPPATQAMVLWQITAQREG
jgi:hypothetical protein